MLQKPEEPEAAAKWEEYLNKKAAPIMTMAPPLLLWSTKQQGVPQGSPTSPFLSIVALNKSMNL